MASEKSQIRERAMAVTIASLNQMRDFDVETLPRVWDLGRGPHRQRRTHEGTATPCSEDDRCKNGCVPRSVEKERRPPLRHQSIRSGGNLRVFENLAQTLVAVDAS